MSQTQEAHVTAASVRRDKTDGSLAVELRVSPPPDGGRIEWVAAAPPERRASAEGSCLPFADERMAFEGSAAMRGVATAREHGAGGAGGHEEGEPYASVVHYAVRLRATPNAFYAGLGTRRVPPSVFVSFEHGGRTYRGSAQVADGVPFRSLTYPAIRADASASIYRPSPAQAEVRSQEEILRASAFPSDGAPPSFGLPLNLPAAAPGTPAAFWGGKPPL